MVKTDNLTLSRLANGDGPPSGVSPAHRWVWIRLLQQVRAAGALLIHTEVPFADSISRALQLQEEESPVEPRLPDPDCACEGCPGHSDLVIPWVAPPCQDC